jgi:hypothetical protein
MLFVSSFLLSLSSSGGHRSSFQIIVPEMYTPRRSSFAGMSILDPVPRPARPGVLATMGWRQRRRGPVEVANSPSSHTGFCAPNKLHGKTTALCSATDRVPSRRDPLLHRQLAACPHDSVSSSSVTPPPPRSCQQKTRTHRPAPIKSAVIGIRIAGLCDSPHPRSTTHQQN